MPLGVQGHAQQRAEHWQQQEARSHAQPLPHGICRPATIESRIEPLGATHLPGIRPGPHRLVANHPPRLENRRDIGVDPIEIAIAATVLDDAHPAFAGLEVVPHLPEYLLWHVRVANQVVRAADQLLAAEAADSDELVIAVGDDAAAIGGRSQMLVGREVALPLGDRHVLAHLYSC
ncbi:hypothetical protein D3C84_624030 [compost metagenome]